MTQRTVTLTLPVDTARWLQEHARESEQTRRWKFNPDTLHWSRIRARLDEERP